MLQAIKRYTKLMMRRIKWGGDEFDEDEEVVEFKDVLELCAAKKEKISTQEDKYRHVSSAGDPRAASAPDLSSLLLL